MSIQIRYHLVYFSVFALLFCQSIAWSANKSNQQDFGKTLDAYDLEASTDENTIDEDTTTTDKKKVRPRATSKPTNHAHTSVAKSVAHSTANPGFFSLALGTGLPQGDWSARPDHGLFLSAEGAYNKIFSPAYLKVSLDTAQSFNHPRDHTLAGNLGIGLCGLHQKAFPQLGILAGVANVVSSGKGKAFGFKFAGEAGISPLIIGPTRLGLKMQYHWVPTKLADRSPRWINLMLVLLF